MKATWVLLFTFVAELLRQFFNFENMKRIQKIHVWFWLAFSLPTCIHAQQVKVFYGGFFSVTTDVLLWEGEEYMCSKSPLSEFKDYKTIFGSVTSLTSENHDPESPFDLDKNYKAKWIIKDGYLYLYDVEILDGSEEYTNKQSTIEKLTNLSFQKDPNVFHEYPEGVLLASWFSDTIYIKRKPRIEETYCDCMYRCEVFSELIFEEGRLVREGFESIMRISMDINEIYSHSEKYSDPEKYRFDILGVRRINPCMIHLRKNLEKDEIFRDVFFAHTFDEVKWNDTIFMCGQSPLSSFSKYRKIFPNIPFIEVYILLPKFQDKNYTAYWTIVNDRLYLYDIDFYSRQSYLDKRKGSKIFDRVYPKRFRAIEKLTGKNFQQDTSLDKEVIFADWFNGTMYLKRYQDNHKSSADCDYLCEPYHKIIFQNGEIVSIEKTNYMIVKDPAWKY